MYVKMVVHVIYYGWRKQPQHTWLVSKLTGFEPAKLQRQVVTEFLRQKLRQLNGKYDIFRKNNLTNVLQELEAPLDSIFTPCDSLHCYLRIPSIHVRIECSNCAKHNIVGFRYKCLQCSNFNLCSDCESRGQHAQHVMVRLPNSSSTDLLPQFMTNRAWSKEQSENEHKVVSTNSRPTSALLCVKPKMSALPQTAQSSLRSSTPQLPASPNAYHCVRRSAKMLAAKAAFLASLERRARSEAAKQLSTKLANSATDDSEPLSLGSSTNPSTVECWCTRKPPANYKTVRVTAV